MSHTHCDGSDYDGSVGKLVGYVCLQQASKMYRGGGAGNYQLSFAVLNGAGSQGLENDLY